MAKYNQAKAMLAITKASLISISRSPSAIVFSIFFPLIFIMVFGLIGTNTGQSYKIVLDPSGDTTNAVLDSLRKLGNVKFVTYEDAKQQQSDLAKGRFAGILSFHEDSAGKLKIAFRSTTASADKFSTFLPLVENIINKIDRERFTDRQTIATIQPEIRQVRKYRTIDFILPGQLGFSLLSAGVFGVAFLFFSLRQQMVLKRFYATPISRGHIVLGEGISRVIFQLITAIIIVAIGHYAFDFTLIYGWQTFLEIIVLSTIALLVFMGFGFVVSGVAKSESSIPPFANIITLPQFLLAGTFFSIDLFPKWLQPISRSLPLTYFNDAMRKISFEGAHLTDCWKEIAILGLWGVIAYAVAIKVFRWE